MSAKNNMAISMIMDKIGQRCRYNYKYYHYHYKTNNLASRWLLLSLLMLTSHLLVAQHNCTNGQRFTRRWWYDFKSNQNGSSNGLVFYDQLGPQYMFDPNTLPSTQWIIDNNIANMNNDYLTSLKDQHLTANSEVFYGPTDDELMTQASKLSSHMTRIMAPTPSTLSSKFDLPSNNQPVTSATKFDDTINSNSELFHQSDNQPKPNKSPSSTSVPAVAESNAVQQKTSASNNRPFFTNFSPMSNNGFSGGHQQPQKNAQLGSYSDRIWSFFDNNMNRGVHQRPQSWKAFGRDDESGSINGIVDSYIEKLVKRNQAREKKQASPTSSSTSSSTKGGNVKAKTSKDQNNNNILSLNLNRKKNPEEKEQFRKLIQNIFDSTPRKSYGGYGDNDQPAGTGGGYKMDPNVVSEDDDDGIMAQQRNENESEEDILKGEKEENVSLKEETLDDGSNGANDDIVDKIATNDDIDETIDPEINEERANLIQAKHDQQQQQQQTNVVDESEDESDNVDNSKSKSNIENRDVTDEDDSVEDDNQDDELHNQYLKRIRKNDTLPFTYGTRMPSTKPVVNRLQTNLTQQQIKKKMTFRPMNHFTVAPPVPRPARNPKNSGPLSFPTTTDSSFGFNDDVILTTVSPFTLTPPTEMDESLNLSNEQLVAFDELAINNNSTEIITEPEPDLKSLLITKRKPQQVGKWMDAETFELRNDDNDDDEEEEEISTTTMTTSGRPKTIDIDFKPRAALKPAIQPRFTRQNLDDDADDIAKLSRTLPGVPGQDYPVFGSIPRTGFNCQDHKWPGYYADVETQCQVFHICQMGGRKTSFLCPNGTMFNQQLFVCDWWHNVQCDEVPSHYELNAQIYDHNWESTRLQKPGQTGASGGIGHQRPKAQPVRVSIRRMAVLEDSTSNSIQSDHQNDTLTTNSLDKTKHDQLIVDGEQSSLTPPSTTLSPPVTITSINNPTTTTETSVSLTETVFGLRRSPTLSNNENEKQQALQERNTQQKEDINKAVKRKTFIEATKGGSHSASSSSLTNPSGLSKFSKFIQNSKTKSALHHQQQHFNSNLMVNGHLSSSSTSTGQNTAAKFARHKFAHQSQMTKTTPLPQLMSMTNQQHQQTQFKSARFQMTPPPLRMSTRPGKYYRT